MTLSVLAAGIVGVILNIILPREPGERSTINDDTEGGDDAEKQLQLEEPARSDG